MSIFRSVFNFAFLKKVLPYLYLLLFLPTQLPWTLLHGHGPSDCSPDEHPEIHACHISVHHLVGEAVHACQHKAHLSAKEEVCAICSFHFNNHMVLPAAAERAEVCLRRPIHYFVPEGNDGQYIENFQNKGPPVV